MNAAPECAGSDDPLPDQTMLYLNAPRGRVERAVRESLQALNLPILEPFRHVLAVAVNAEDMHDLSNVLFRSLTPAERQAIRCRMAPSGEPSPAQLMQSTTLDQVIAWVDSQWLAEVLRQRRLVAYFQPIVVSRDPGQVFAYECLIRGREADGRLIPPDRLYGAARATGLLNALDQAARLTAIESSASRKLATNVFVNFNPRSIDDPVRCLGSTLRAALTSGLSPDRFIFEVVESDEIVDTDNLLEILDYCRDAGCRVALDDLGAGYSSLNLMTRLKPDFVKLDMELIRNVDRDPYKSCVASKLIELAKELNVDTVVEGVETTGEWQWATEHGADYAQGFLFATPQAEPPMSSFSAHRPVVCVSEEHSTRDLTGYPPNVET